MRPRVILLGALAARAKVEADIVINTDIIYRKPVEIPVIDADRLMREQDRDVCIQTAQMRHFHDKQIKIKKFRK